MFFLIEQDYQRVSDSPGSILRYIRLAILNAGFRAILFYRVGVWMRRKGIRILPALLERLTHHLCHCWISFTAEIGPGLLIAHVGGIVIGGKTIIGKNCDIRQNVTFGGNYNKTDKNGRTQPWVGDNVSVGVNAVIIGPVRVGSNSIIGANTVVNRDVSENAIVFGVPAKVVGRRWDLMSNRGL